ncbi:hypothetical protein M5C97_13305 [Acidovorax sp. NCPPB 3859]|nr:MULTISPECIES: hypothetical protein [unclassified Acidovorax]MDA8451407.1 hypothetical protein [Acidovorax sp. GBBC 3297]MDA8460852.1 hypothetical protein [Acidovorax sp. GBBC 3333]MDA8465814.1 hypothetical protein [Acidovorax sp. GBBC 3332]MDA8470922.1 hypothetical protein [Acidovorax sp. GBBC 3299]WCM76512.1 hypothetical protein M5C94_13260 [Acidovorax sp. GBBC 712]
MVPSPLRLPRASRLICMMGLSVPLLAMASPAGDALQRLQGDTWVTRSFALSDLGFTDAVLLNGFDAKQEFFLPVPRTLPLAEASIDFNGRYYKAEEGRTSMLLSVNGRPVFSRRIESPEGDASQVLKVDTSVRTNGFLRLGVNWLNNVAHRICEVERATGNVLSVAAETRFNYRFSSGALTSLADAWVTLPARPTLLVASRNLSKASYDTAWRIGAALEQANRRVVVKAFPVPGDTVDTTGWQVPSGLASLPAFAGLATGNARYVLKDDAEIGALVVLGAVSATGDIAVADGALQQQIGKALDALGAQLAGDADGARAFTAWRNLQTVAAPGGLASHQIRLATLGARPVIAVAEDAGAQAAGVFVEVWRNILVTRQATVARADAPDAEDRTVIRLAGFGSDASFDVVSRGDWTASLPLAAVAVNGRMPSDLVIDIAAAPGASSTRPVASVFWNNVLLSARRLEADGRPERLDARVPGYALGLSNVVRVSVQRQPYSNDCNETPQGFPVNVLPTSYVRAGDSEPDGTFVGLLPLMSGTPVVAVPASYLADAPQSLARLIRIAVAAGVTPVRAEFAVVEQGKPFAPGRPFLALQVPVQGTEPKVQIQDAHLRINGRNAPWLDVDGLARLSAVEVSRSNGQHGLVWQPLGEQTAAVQKAFVLNRGDIALIGADGPVSWVDSSNPSASLPPGAGESAFYEWRRYLSWGVPLLSILLLVVLLVLVAAYRARRRAEQRRSS